MDKRGIELTISTLVVIILSLLVLTFGILFTGNVFCKGIQGVNSVGELTNQEINNLFSEQDDSLVAVKEKTNEINKLTYYGVAFFIKNSDPESDSFTYNVDVFDLQDCGITEEVARSYIITSKSSTANIAKGETHSDIIEFKIPKEAPTCSLKYKIDVTKGGELYDSAIFIVRIKEPSLFTRIAC